MPRDPRIDAYIAKSADFARPILEHVRELVHETVPDASEAIKWGMPHFTFKGKSIAGMAAFKAHCAVMVHGDGRQNADGMGGYGKITSLKELPSDDALAAKFREAVERIEDKGTAARRSPRLAPKPELAVPRDFAAALRENARASATFEAFPPSQRREYVEWVSDARQDATRAKRLATSIEWLAQGKRRNWKYETR